MENELNELQQMRRQLDALRRKLDRQEIVSATILRRAMSGHAAAIRTRLAITGIIVGMAVVYCPCVLYHYGLSWAISAVTALFLLLSFAVTLYERRAANPSRLMAGTLVDTARRVARIKRLERNWQRRVGFPFLAVWLPWLCAEFYLSLADDPVALGIMFGAVALGIVVGGLIGWALYKRTMRDADDMLASIAELTADGANADERAD